jgi:hypothetical protein
LRKIPVLLCQKTVEPGQAIEKSGASELLRNPPVAVARDRVAVRHGVVIAKK